MVGLAIFAILVLMISNFGLQINLYRQAAKQLYSATSKCEDMIEKLWSGVDLPDNKTVTIDEFTINILVVPGPRQAFKYVQITASWLSVFKRSQTIKFDVICL